MYRFWDMIVLKQIIGVAYDMKVKKHEPIEIVFLMQNYKLVDFRFKIVIRI